MRRDDSDSRHGSRLVVSALTVILMLAISAGDAALAADPVVDPPTSAGARNSPGDMGWADAGRPCTHYVDTAQGASDSTGDGSATRPWRTIGHAVARLGPGNTLCVRAGTYAEGAIEPGLTSKASAAQPIVVKAQNPGTVTITPRAGSEASAFFGLNNNAKLGTSVAPEVSYWLIEGFVMDKQRQDGPGVYFFGSPGSVHHIAIRNNVIRNSKAAAGIVIRGRVHDVIVKGNTIAGHSRWMRPEEPGSSRRVDPQYTQATPTHRRVDAHGIAIEGTAIYQNGVRTRSVERIRVERNTLQDNGGDGLQCLGENDDAGQPQPGDPVDLDIVDNRVVNSSTAASLERYGYDPTEENGFDIKSCDGVSIRNTPPTSASAPVAQDSKISGLLPTASALDYGGNNSEGAAIIIHYSARNVLVEYTRMWNVCAGIVVARPTTKVQNVVIRRNLIFGLRYNQVPPGGAAADAGRCSGRALQLTNADNVDVYHNTFDGVPRTAIQVGSSDSGTPTNIDIWNNIMVLSNAVGTAPRYWVNITKGSGVDSDYNLLWHAGGAAAGTRHFRVGATEMDLTGWRATNRDLARGSKPRADWADPQFPADPNSNDYYTLVTSPARDGGLPNTGALSCGVRPDIGFLESCR